MIDITGVEKQEPKQEVQPTYSPELGNWFLTDKRNPADIYQSLSVDYQEGRAGSYFGNIETTPREDIGFFNKAIGTPLRATTRGFIGLGAGLGKAEVLSEAWFNDFFYDLAQDVGFRRRELELDEMLQKGKVSQEQYDAYKQTIDNDRKGIIEYNQKARAKELEDTKHRLEKISLWNERVVQALGVEQKEGEWKTLSALFESAPSTLAALGVFIATKNPYLAATLFGGAVLAPQAAEMAEQEIELGKDLHSALAIGTVTGVASGSLDYFGAKGLSTLFLSGLRNSIAKNRVYAAMQSFVFKNADNMAVRDFGTYFRMGIAGAVEEGVTEGAQAVIEANLPRAMGGGKEWQGFWNEINDYAFQSWIGTLSGGLFGSIGGAVSFKALSKDIENNLVERGIDKDVAKAVAPEIARPLIEKTQEITETIVKDIDNTKMTPDEYGKAAKALRGGFTPEDIERQRQLIEKNYDAKFIQGQGNANKIASYITLANAQLEADIENTNLDAAVNKIRLDVVDGTSGIEVSDQFYNARNKKGDIVGAATKDLNNHIIYLLNNATPDVLIHELTHIYLNTITRAMNSGKISANFSQAIGNVVDVLGVPEGPNNTFSERQQEELASLFQEIGKTGEAPSLQLQESFAQVQQLAKGALEGAKAVGEFNPKVKKLFADFFAPFQARLDIDTSVESINNMKKAISDIKSGKRPSVRDVVMLTKLLQFGRGYRPGWIGYSVQDYINEHPEYMQASVQQKRAMLEQEGFEIAAEREGFADDALAMQAIEANAAITFRKDEKNAIKRREDIAKYAEIAQVYKEVFNNNQLEADFIGDKILDLRKQGYVIADKEFVTKLSKDLTQLKNSFVAAKKKISSLEEKIKTLKAANEAQKAALLEKQMLSEAKATGKQITNMLFGVSISLSDVGIDVDSLTKMGLELDEALQTNDLTKITERENTLLKELETYSNQLIEKYYNSDFYKEQEGIVPPVVDKKAANSALVGIITRQISNTKVGGTVNFAKIYADVDRMLQKQGVALETRYKILLDLNKQRINIATGRNVNEIVERVIDDANEAYRKEMYARTDNKFKKLLERARGKKLEGNYNTAVIKAGELVSQMEQLAKKKGLPSKRAALEDFLINLDINDITVGTDAEGNDIKVSSEQAKFIASVLNVTRSRLTDDPSIPTSMLQEAYTQIDSFDKFTQERVQRFQAQKAMQLKKRVTEALQLVAKRKKLPGFLQKMDSLLFAGPLGGLRSNLIAVFGEEYARYMDATVESALGMAQLKRYREVLNDFIASKIKGISPQAYKARLAYEYPYANPRNNIEELLKDYTRGQLLDLWLTSRNWWENKQRGKDIDDKAMRWVRRTFGDNAEAVVAYLNSGKGLSALDRQVGSFMMSQMREIYPEIADTYMGITGKPLGYQENYWPLYVMTRQSSEIVLDDMMYFNANPVTKTGPGMTKERVGVATDPSVNPERILRLDNPLDKFDRYFRSATKYINVTPKMNVISEIVRGNSAESQSLRTAIEEKFGNSMLNALMNDIEYVLGVQRYKEQSTLNKGLNEVLSNFVIGKIAMVPWIGIKQTVAIMNYAERMPMGQFVNGFLSGISHPKETWNEMMKYKAVYTRFKGQIPMAFMENKSLQTEMLLGLVSKETRAKIGENNIAAFSAALSKIKSMALFNVRLGDAVSVVYGGYAYVQYLKERINNDPELSKMSEEDKQAYIEEELISMTETSQQSALDTTRGNLQRSEDMDGALVKRAIMTFSTANSQYVRKIREAAYEYRNGKISRGQAMKTFVIYGLMNPVMFAMLSMPGLWAAMFRAAADEDDEEARKKVYLAFMRPVLDNIFSAYGNLGGLGDMLTDAAAKKAGQETFGIDGDMSPFFVKDFERALSTVSKTNKEISTEEWLDFFLVAGQGLSPLPLQNVKKMLKGLYGVTTDEEAWEKWASAATVLGISERQAKQLFEE